MSLHAQLSPEAAQRLRAQKRNSTLASLLISILVIVLVGLLLALWALRAVNIEQPDIVTYKASSNEETDDDVKPVNPTLQRKPTPPSSSIARVITSNSASAVAIPTPDNNFSLPTTDFGDSNDDFGAGWGNESSSGEFGNIPAEMRKRCSKADRLQRLARNGGNEACEEAVLRALRWLQKKQNADGSFGSEKPVAMTGLALLAFLGHCETPLSQEFGSNVENAMAFLVNNNLSQNGKSASDLADKHWPYEHSIAMYALGESYTFCKQLNIEDVVPQMAEAVEGGIKWILENQTEKGGWDYSYNLNKRPGDSSIVAWHLQALKAALSTGIDFPKIKPAIANGLNFLELCQNENGGFGYTVNRKPVGSADGHFTLTGAGALCFQQHKGTSNTNARKGIRYLEKNASFNASNKGPNLYEHYYNSQAMINNGGETWRNYNKLTRDVLLKNQLEDGSWPNSWSKGYKDPVYRVTLATLMLEVYYRFLPGTGGGK